MKTGLTSRQVVALVTSFKPSSCSCARCRAMCERTPCMGTPEDIFRLLQAGYADQLVATFWHAGREIGLPVIPMVQLRARDRDADGCGACVMLRNGRCSIHAIKPLGGQLATHEPCHMEEGPDVAVALSWLLPRNLKIITHLLEYFA